MSGKTITRALVGEQAEHDRPWFDNAKHRGKLVDQLKRLAIEQAEIDDQWPAT